MSGELNGTVTGPGTFDETGTTTIGSSLFLADGAVIENEGTLSTGVGTSVTTDGASGDEIINVSAAVININGPNSINAALSSSGTINVITGFSSIGGVLTNTGTINFSSGSSGASDNVILDFVHNSSSSGTIILPSFDALEEGVGVTVTNSGTIEFEGDDGVNAGSGSTLANNGVISVTGSDNTILGDITGIGTVRILAGGSLDIQSETNIASSQDVILAGVGATLGVSAGSLHSGTLSSMQPGSSVDFTSLGVSLARGTPLGGAFEAAVSGGNLVLSELEDSTFVPVGSVGWSAGSNPIFALTADGDGGIDVTLSAGAVSDFYGTGTSDILWQNSSTDQAAIWEMSGGAPTAYSIIGGVPSGWQVAGSGDFNGDGMADILWQNQSSGQAAIWLMNGASATSYNTIDAIPSGWQVAGVGDFNSDGDADILWRNPATTQIAVWEMNAATPTSETIIGTAPSAWKVGGVADFNSDGDADILWQNSSTGQIAIWEMNGSSVLAYNTIGTAPSGWQIAGSGDFAGNGTQDILFQNTTTDQLAVWQTNGASLTGSAIIANGVPFASGWQIAAVGDYTGSGADSILWQNSSTGQAALWQTNGSSLTSTSIIASGIASGWTVAHNPVLAA